MGFFEEQNWYLKKLKFEITICNIKKLKRRTKLFTLCFHRTRRSNICRVLRSDMAIKKSIHIISAIVSMSRFIVKSISTASNDNNFLLP